jgi:transcriptional regulator with XRE-family HTH domain
MHVGRLIRSLRQERGIRASELAETIGVSRSYISRIENEDRRLSTKILLNIARALSVDPSTLLDAARQDPRERRLRKALELSLRGRLLNPRFVNGLLAFLEELDPDSVVFEAWGEEARRCAQQLGKSLSDPDFASWSYSHKRNWVRDHLVEFVENLEFFENVVEETLFIEEPPDVAAPREVRSEETGRIPVLSTGDDLPRAEELGALSPFPQAADEKLFAFVVQDNSMSPVYEPGTAVVFSFDRSAQEADRVVACLANGRLICKVLRRRQSWVQLVSQNPIYEPLFLKEEELRWVHPVVGSLGR